MNAVTKKEAVALAAARPQYFATSEAVVRNAEAVQVGEAYNLASAAQDRVSTSCAGAILAQVFLKYVWLSSFALELETSSEYDDQGGNYRSVNITISDAEAIDGAVIPEDFLDSEGRFDPDVFADSLREDLDDSNGELYDGFNHCSWSYDDFKVTVKRELIADLLLQEEVGGADAFVLLFPDKADLANGTFS